MKIGYIGNTRPFHSTETHISATLEDMGHEVVRIQEDELRPGELINRVEGCDLLLWTRTWKGNVSLEDIRSVGELMPTVSYHLDLYLGIQREQDMADDPFWSTQYVFTTDGDPQSLTKFKEMGINHFYLPAGVYDNECYKGTPNPEFVCDVAFVGSGHGYHHDDWPYRLKLIKWLRETYGDRYKKFGSPEQVVRNKELNDLYASVKVVVGDSLCKGFTHENYWSDRLYETTGRGGFLIMPYIKGIDGQFRDLVTYKFDDFYELRSKIDYYVENKGARNMIRDSTFEEAKKRHTYKHRMTKLLEIVNEN